MTNKKSTKKKRKKPRIGTKPKFKNKDDGIWFPPITNEDQIEILTYLGIYDVRDFDLDYETNRINEITKNGLKEAYKLRLLSETASTNEIQEYLKDNPVSAHGIAFLSTVYNVNNGGKGGNGKAAAFKEKMDGPDSPYNKLYEDAGRLVANGTKPCNVASKLAEKHPYTARRIRDILKIRDTEK